jgi:hypothetical protein
MEHIKDADRQQSRFVIRASLFGWKLTRYSVTQAVSAVSTPLTDTSSLSELSETPSSEVGSVSFDGPGVADVDEDSAGEYRSDNNNNTYDDQKEAEVSSKTSQSSLADITTAQSEAY